MADFVKSWDNGGNLSATYNGSGDGEAIFTSDINEGIDRTMGVSFVDANRSVIVKREVEQIGLRQQFVTSDSLVFKVSEGRFGVLKVGGVEPDEPTIETYTRLSYIKATGEQYIDLGYVVKSTDTIEAYYDTIVESVDKFLYGVGGSNGSVWLSLYSTYAYVRFGQTSSKSIGNGAINHYVKAKQKSVTLDATTTTLDYVGMPTASLYLFAGNGGSNNPYNYYEGTATMFKITAGDGSVIYDLRPVKRDSDGKIGMLDLVNGTFYTSASEVEFQGGTEIHITDDYELMDRVTFNNDKIFDIGYYGNGSTYIDVMFQRTDISGNDYLLGCTSGNRLTAYLSSSSSGYWRYGNAYPQMSTNSKKIYKASITPTKTTVDRTSKTFSEQSFTTSFTLPLGGSKGTTDEATASFQGYVYYFEMRHADTQLAEWYPCRRKSDGVEGFWDCVTNTFVEPI